MAAPLLMRWFRRKVAPADLDDLVQDTLLAVHQRRASWDPARPFLPWLAAIARYRWVDRLRRARVRDTDALFDDIAVESGEAALIGRLGCDRLLALLPSAQAAAIRAVNAGYEPGADGLQREIEEFGKCFGTADFKEGTRAFMEKRKAEFKGD